MRTDITMDRKQVVCSNTSLLGYGKVMAQTGDLVTFTEHYTNGTHGSGIGRVIAHIPHVPAIEAGEQPMRDALCVIALMHGMDCVGERWIDPADVTSITAMDTKDAFRQKHADKIRDLVAFFMSSELPKYSPEELRQWAASGYATMEQFMDRPR